MNKLRLINPILNKSRILADLNPTNFEAWFGHQMRQHADVVRVRIEINKAIPQTHAGNLIREIAKNTLKVGLTSKYVVQIIKSAIAEYLDMNTEKIKICTLTYKEEVNRRYGPTRDITCAERQQIHGNWNCSSCSKYVGSGQGIWDHSRSVHGTLQVRDVNALSEQITYTFPNACVVFHEQIVKSIRKHAAAKTIQTRWRTSISCPIKGGS